MNDSGMKMQPSLPVFPSISRPTPLAAWLHSARFARLVKSLLAGVGVTALLVAVYLALVAPPATLQRPYAPEDVASGSAFVAGQAGVVYPAANLESSTSAVVLIREKFFDFGSISATQIVQHTFVIANTGSSPLLIRRAATTCGCTQAEFSAAVIPAGKVALVTLSFDPAYHDMRGTTVRRGLTIETNDAHNPVQEIWIQAAVQ
jgi:hypothetical protein